MNIAANAAPALPEVVLVTGFPRLLARGLTRRVLEAHPESRVLLFTPRAELPRAEAFRGRLPPDAQPRLSILPGGLLDVDLGLTGSDVRQVLRDATLVMHTATLQTGPRGLMRRVNVGGLINMLKLARDMDHLHRFGFFSSAFVSGSRAGVIHEEDLACGQRLRTTFERTLFAAEQIAREVMPRLPITVLRPGSMLGHSRTGETEALDEGPNYLVRLMVRLPAEVPVILPGSGVVPLNIVPIDYVVRAAHVLLSRPEAVGRTFHVTDPNPLSARQAFEILSDVAQRPTPFTGSLPVRAVRQFLKLPGLDWLAPRKLALFEDLNTHVIYDCSGTLELLAGTDVVCPPFESYADQLVAWVAQYERNARHPTVSAPPAAVPPV